MTNKFYFPDALEIRWDPRLNNKVIKEIFGGFTFNKIALEFKDGVENALSCGVNSAPVLPKDASFICEICREGFGISAKDYPSLARGLLTLLMQIQYENDGSLYMESGIFTDNYKVENRMLHICVFPETTLDLLKKLIRLSGALQYTHIVLEFWGTLRFDCLPELGWQSAYAKDEIKPLIEEIKLLGMEPIPMFNCLGHASNSRWCSAKHTVLNQNLSLYPLFTPDGWAWNLENEDTWSLFRSVRKELYELFGEGEYFHLGLDESHNHNSDPYLFSRLPVYLERLTKEVSAEGRRPIVWCDMILPKDAFVNMDGQAHSIRSIEESDKLLNLISKDTVLVDWEYWVYKAPISSLSYLSSCSFDVMGAPWFDTRNVRAHIDTVREYGMFGIMQTTWHKIAEKLYELIPSAKELGAILPPWESKCRPFSVCAALLRQLMNTVSDSHSSGCVEKQICNDAIY